MNGEVALKSSGSGDERAAADSVAVAEERLGWRRSEERRRAMLVGLAIAPAALIGYVLGGQIDTGSTGTGAAIGAVVGIYLGFMGWMAYRLQMHRSYLDRQLVEQSADIDADVASEEQEPLGLEPLWNATEKRLRLYHDIATNQARVSFQLAMVAMSVGFVVLLAPAVLAVRSTTTAGSIAAGAIGATGGAVSAYLGATFLRAYSESTQQLRSYFLQPVELSRLLAAERIALQLEGPERAAALRDIVTAATGQPSTERP